MLMSSKLRGGALAVFCLGSLLVLVGAPVLRGEEGCTGVATWVIPGV